MKQEHMKVTVTDVDIKFWTMVSLMVRWAIATIPAMLILGFCTAVMAMVIAGAFR